MIVKVKVKPSRINKGTYTDTSSRIIHIDECEQIQADTGRSVITYVRVPVPSTGESCCYGCHLSSKHDGYISGICANIVGCGTYRMHYIEAKELLEEL